MGDSGNIDSQRRRERERERETAIMTTVAILTIIIIDMCNFVPATTISIAPVMMLMCVRGMP